jgi:hypothetical protein
MPLDPTHSSRTFTLLPVDTVNRVATLQAYKELGDSNLRQVYDDAGDLVQDPSWDGRPVDTFKGKLRVSTVVPLDMNSVAHR